VQNSHFVRGIAGEKRRHLSQFTHQQVACGVCAYCVDSGDESVVDEHVASRLKNKLKEEDACGYCLCHRKRIAGGGGKEAGGATLTEQAGRSMSRMTRCAASNLLLLYLILYLQQLPEARPQVTRPRPTKRGNKASTKALHFVNCP
jgi:hypothetical protein